VVEDGDATGQSARSPRRPVSSNGSDNVCYRIITEDTTSLGRGGGLRAAHAIDVVRSTVVSHGALGVAHEGIWISRCLGSPTVTDRIILEGISELGTASLHVAATHRVKLPVGREKTPLNRIPATGISAPAPQLQEDGVPVAVAVAVGGGLTCAP